MKSYTKKITALLLVFVMIFSLAACGKKQAAAQPTPEMSLTVFAPSNSVLVVSNIVDMYKSMSEYATVKIYYDDGAVLASMIEAGYACDIYIADHAEYMDWLDKTVGTEGNPNKNDKIDHDTRKDIFKGYFEVEKEPEYDENDNLIEGTDGTETVELTYSVAMVKSTKYPNEIKKFIEFCGSDYLNDIYKDIDFEKVQ